MINRDTSGLDIYIGGLIEVESERLALKKIAQLLNADGKRAVIFANFHVVSRQIDLFVATMSNVNYFGRSCCLN